MTLAETKTGSDKILFTPGPLSTSATVKGAMLRDLGSRDTTFIKVVRDIRQRLLQLSGASDATHTAVPMQGSGTFAIESVVGSVIPPDGKLLTLVNGAYGRRIAKIAAMLRIEHSELSWSEDRVPDLDEVATVLAADPAITHVAVVHCETTTGIMNPVRDIGALVADQERSFFVDAMSSFGAVPIDVGECKIDYLVSSANKCIEGVPGFGFVIARKKALEQTEGFARSLSFDLLAQWKNLDATGQFRFTPPTHALLAFNQALIELEEEGGIEGRGRRYAANHERLVVAMRSLGFREYLDPSLQGCIITSFLYPSDVAFEFEDFYRRLADKGMVIYPGKVSQASCFRIGNIGQIFSRQIDDLTAAIETTLAEMGMRSGA